MPHSARFTTSLGFALLTACGLVACKKASTEPQPNETAPLVGRWKLVNRQCFCPSALTPDEIVTFTAQGFAFYRNGRFVSDGTYADATATLCGGPVPTPVLRFTYATLRLMPLNAVATVRTNTLVLDYGGACDAPIDTYQRLP